MRIVLIDEQPLVREGLACILQRETGMLFCGGAGSAREGLKLVDEERPDLLVLDVFLPGLGGIAAIREARRRQSSLKVAVLSASCCERDVLDALRAGALGYFGKSDSMPTLVTGLRAVASGELSLGPSIRRLALPALPRGASAPEASDVLARLSNREREVFELAVRGYRNREIARELCIAIKTVGSHRLQINRKLGCSSTPELIYFAATNGLLPAPVGEERRLYRSELSVAAAQM